MFHTSKQKAKTASRLAAGALTSGVAAGADQTRVKAFPKPQPLENL